MGTEQLEKVFSMTRGVMENVRPEQLDGPTPCESWDVRRLINHIIGGSHWFAVSVNEGQSPAVDTTAEDDYTAGDLLATYDSGIKPLPGGVRRARRAGQDREAALGRDAGGRPFSGWP